MTDEQPQGRQAPHELPSVTPGRLLREAREQQRMSAKSVADGLHLRLQVVEDLEQDRYESLPPLTFVKGYLRAYAKLVDVPQERVMAAFGQLGLEQEEPERPLPQGERSGDGGGWRWVSWLVLAAVVVLFALWLRGEEGQQFLSEVGLANEPASEQQEPPVQPEGEREAPRSDAAPEPGQGAAAVEPRVEDSPAPRQPTAAPVAEPESRPEPQPQLQSETTEAPATPAPPAREPAPAEPAPAESEPVVQAAPTSRSAPVAEQERQSASPRALIIRVRESSWMDVRDADGERVLFGNIQGPEVYRFEGPEPFSLVIGNAEAVEVEYGGESVSLRPHTRGRVARLQIPPRR